MSVSDIGDLLVSFSARNETSDQMTKQLRSIHDEFIRNRDARAGYFRMGFLAAKAIERCRQLEEGSDVGDHAGDRAGGTTAGDRAGSAAVDPLAQPRSAPAYPPPPPPAD
jgi:hypothetical protein